MSPRRLSSTEFDMWFEVSYLRWNTVVLKHSCIGEKNDRSSIYYGLEGCEVTFIGFEGI